MASFIVNKIIDFKIVLVYKMGDLHQVAAFD